MSDGESCANELHTKVPEIISLLLKRKLFKCNYHDCKVSTVIKNICFFFRKSSLVSSLWAWWQHFFLSISHFKGFQQKGYTIFYRKCLRPLYRKKSKNIMVICLSLSKRVLPVIHHRTENQSGNEALKLHDIMKISKQADKVGTIAKYLAK